MMGCGGHGLGGHGFLLTGEVEECVEDVEALHVVPLDELVGVIVEDFGPGEEAQSCTLCQGSSQCVCVPPPSPWGPKLTP